MLHYPLLARAYASGQSLYHRMLRDLVDTLLPEVHALSSALGVKSTWVCVQGFEECKKAMGGQPHVRLRHHFRHEYVVTDMIRRWQLVISQQIARSLVKALFLLKNPKLPFQKISPPPRPRLQQRS